MNDVLDGGPSRARSATDPVRRVRDRGDPGVRPADHAARLPPDHQRLDARRPGGGAARRRGGDPGTAGPDLRPQGPAARLERRDLDGQGHALGPAVQPPRRCHRRAWARSWAWTRPTSSRRSTAPPARGSTPCGSPRTCRNGRRGSISESTEELPGVLVAVETRRQYPDGPLLAHILGYTGPIDGGAYARLRGSGYLPDDLMGKAGIESTFEDELRGTYGIRAVERDATGRDIQVLRTVQAAVPGASLHAHDRQDHPAGGDPGAQVGDEGRRPQARRVHRHEPADGRGPRPREPPLLRQQPVRARHLGQGLREAVQEQGQAAHQPRGPGPLPAGLDVQARRGHRRARRTGRSRRRRASGPAAT